MDMEMATPQEDLSALAAAADAAARQIPPAWPLASVAAVNPFLGQTGETLAATSARLTRVGAVPVTMERGWYQERIEAGEITDDDLTAALAACPHDAKPRDLAALRDAAAAPRPAREALPTIADLAAEASGIDWPALIADRIGAWASSHFDQGQALWTAPRGHSAWEAFRSHATHDLTPEIMGLDGFARFVFDAGDAPLDTLARATRRLDVDAAARATYFHQLLFSLGGLAQYARYELWRAELAGGTDSAITDLLAIRLLWEEALYARYESAIRDRWEAVRAAHAVPVTPAEHDVVDEILQEAAERAAQRGVAKTLAASTPVARDERPTLQGIFCIDVRSEVFRRALEAVDPAIRTSGFAGFFAVFAKHRGFASDVDELRLPVLLNPTITSCSGHAGDADKDLATRYALRAKRAWGRFKLAAVSSFAFVEAMGPVYIRRLLRDALHLNPKPTPNDPTPRFEPELDLASRIAAAETVLRAMSLTSGFARIVLLAGHGASVVNNPHASGLQCGACGGYSGEVNARLLALLLNDAAVREGLVERGIEVPADTLFLGALHDTTTDEVTLYDQDTAAPEHAGDLEKVRRWLAAAGKVCRGERALRLPRASGPGDVARAGGPGQAQRPLAAAHLAGGGEPSAHLLEVARVLRCGGVLVVERHLVGRRVVQRAEEQRVGGHLDTALDEPFADRRVVQEQRQQARVDLARIAAAGAALQTAGVRVVDDAGAVAGQQDDAGEAAGQRHRAQHGLRGRDPRREVELRLEARRRVVRRGLRVEVEGVAQEAPDVDRAHRLDEREGRDRRQLETAPRPLGAQGVAGGEVLVRVARVPRARGDRRVQEHRQAQLVDIGGEAPMFGEDGEEAREPARADRRIDRLQGAAEYFRADVDAEDPLQRGPLVAGDGGGSGERLRHPALRRTLGGLLQDLVDDVVFRRRHRDRMGRAHRLPAVADRALVARVERLLPEQSDRQQIGDRAVGAAGELGPPQLVARVLRQAAEREEELVEVGGARGGVDVEAPRRAGERVERRVAGVEDEAGETVEPHDLGREIVGRVAAEGFPGAVATRRRPQRLALVEMARRPGPDPIGDECRPVDAARFGGEVGDGGQRLPRRPRRGGGVAQCCEIARLGVVRARGERRREVVVGDLARFDALLIPAPLHRHGHGADARETCARGRQGLAGLSQKGVDRGDGGERPGRRDLPRRRVGGGGERREVLLRGRHFHVHEIELLFSLGVRRGGGRPSCRPADRTGRWRRGRSTDARAGRRRRDDGPRAGTGPGRGRRGRRRARPPP